MSVAQQAFARRNAPTRHSTISGTSHTTPRQSIEFFSLALLSRRRRRRRQQQQAVEVNLNATCRNAAEEEKSFLFVPSAAAALWLTLFAAAIAIRCAVSLACNPSEQNEACRCVGPSDTTTGEQRRQEASSSNSCAPLERSEASQPASGHCALRPLRRRRRWGAQRVKGEAPRDQLIGAHSRNASFRTLHS